MFLYEIQEIIYIVLDLFVFTKYLWENFPFQYIENFFFFFRATLYYIVGYKPKIILSQPLIDGHLGYFQPFAITNKVATNKLVYKSFFLCAVLSVG